MMPFDYVESASEADALGEMRAAPEAVFFAGGTTLVDLMKIDVVSPAALVGVSRLPLTEIRFDEAGAHVGANVRNSELAWHSRIRSEYPVLSEAILSGATTQLRNMATTAGNMLQRTRCPYFRDVHARCNKRAPGSGCDALDGETRTHAILGTSEHCIAVFPSDMCAALAILDVVVHTRRLDATTRAIAFGDLHCLPGDTPHRETILDHGELVTSITIPPLPWARRSRYVKVRDRASYEFALSSAAVALDLAGGRIRTARIALGGVATKPWRAREAEARLVGETASSAAFRAAAEAALAGAVPRGRNAFKVDLTRRTLVRALTEAAALVVEESPCP